MKRPRGSARVLLLGGTLLATALVSAPARAGDTLACGNGYCDAWAGETKLSCPIDCARPPPTAPGVVVPGAYGPVYSTPVPRWDEGRRNWMAGDPAPPGFRVVVGPSRGLVVAGASVLGGSWFASFLLAIGARNTGHGYAAIPLAGPFITGGLYRTSPCSGLGCIGTAFDGLAKACFYFVGATELVGAGLLTAGLVVRRPGLVSDAAVTLTPIPVVGENGNGLGLSGTF